MSNLDNSNGSKPRSPLANCFGIGCASIAGIILLGSLSSMGGGGPIIGLLIIGLIIFLVVRSRSKKPFKFPTAPNQVQPTVKVTDSSLYTADYAPAIPQPAAKTSGSSEGRYGNPVCQHRFNAIELRAQTVTCPCGNVFVSQDILELKQLHEDLVTIEREIVSVTKRIKEYVASAAATIQAAAKAAAVTTVAEPKPVVVEKPVQIVEPVAAPEPVAPVAVVKPVKPAKPIVVRAARPKINFSLQQWLIIGAAVLVMVAGSIFVTTGIQSGWSFWIFALVTVGISLIMGFGAFRLRRMSATLANFAAAFSASMMIASLMILGDQIYGDLFMWSDAPAWWWAISLFIVSALTSLLAKLSSNFAFKAIGLLAAATALLLFVVGYLYAQLQLPANLYGAYVAGMSLASVGILYLGRFLVNIKRDDKVDKEFKEYAKQLAEREDNTLRRLTQLSAGASAVVGIALGVVNAGASILSPANPIALVSVTVVWALLGFTSDTWSTLLSKDAKPAKLAKPIATSVVLISGALTLTSATSNFAIANSFVATIITVLVIAAIIWFAQKLPRLTPDFKLIQITMWVGLVTYAIWSGVINDLTSLSTLAIGVGLVLAASDLRFKRHIYPAVAVVVGNLGLFGIAFNLPRENDADVFATSYALVTLVLALATNLQLAVQALVAKASKRELDKISPWLSFAFAALITFYQFSFISSSMSQSLELQLPILITLLAYAAVSLALLAVFKFAKSNRLLFMVHSYLAQALVIVGIFNALYLRNEPATSLATWLLVAVAVINYGFGAVHRSGVLLQLGFAIAYLTFFVNQISQIRETGGSVLLIVETAVIAIATWLHIFATRKLSKSNETSLRATAYLYVTAGMVISIALNAFAITTEESATRFVLTSVLSAFALISAVLSEFARKVKVLGNSATLLAMGLVYAVSAFVIDITFAVSEDHVLALTRLLVSSIVIGGILVRKTREKYLEPLVFLSYLANLGIATLLALITQDLLQTGAAPETFTVWLAAAVIVSTLLVGKKFPVGRMTLLIDVPVLLIAVTSLAYGLTLGNVDNAALLRQLIASLVVSAHGYWRSAKKKLWMISGYVVGAFAATTLGQCIHVWFNFNWEGPEGTTLLLAISVIVGNLVLVRRVKNVAVDLRWGVVVALLAIPSLVWGLTGYQGDSANLARQLVSLAMISAFATVMFKRETRVRIWVGFTYLANIAFFAALAHASYNWFALDFAGPEIYAGLITVGYVLSNLIARQQVKGFGLHFKLGVPVAVLSLPSLVYSFSGDSMTPEQLTRRIISLLLITAYLHLMIKRSKKVAWFAGAQLTTAALMFTIADLLKVENYIEVYSGLIALGIIGTNLLARQQSKALGIHFTVGLPVAVLSLPSLVYSFSGDAMSTEQLTRRIVALLLITAYLHLMIKRSKKVAWFAGAQLTTAALMYTVASALPSFNGPEVYSVLIAAGIVATNLVAREQAKKLGLQLRVGLPVALLSLPSLAFSFLSDQVLFETQARRVLSLLVISGYIFWMTKRSASSRVWTVAAYLSTEASAAAMVVASYQLLAITFAGPEIYAVVLSAGIVLTQKLTKGKFEFKGSLLTWGLPLGILLIPSTIYTYASLQKTFAELDGIEVTRVITIVAASAVLLVLGIRRGNLATTSIGLLGLALTLIPSTAVHSTEVLPGAQIETTAVVVGALAFILMNVLHKRNLVKGTSLVYIGVPVMIMLAPALLASLSALGNPELGQVDWWRFLIILVTGMTLLIVGSLRELGGMFYPGLIAVLLSALPYGFKQSQKDGWILWVLLLIVAGVMVWVAMRLEKMRKAGKSSASWLKELK